MIKNITGAEIKLISRDIVKKLVKKEVVMSPIVVSYEMRAVKVGTRTVYRSQDIKKAESAKKIIHNMTSLIVDNDKIISLAGDMVNAENVYSSKHKKLLNELKRLYAMPVFEVKKKWFFKIKCPYVKSKIEVPKDDLDSAR